MVCEASGYHPKVLAVVDLRLAVEVLDDRRVAGGVIERQMNGGRIATGGVVELDHLHVGLADPRYRLAQSLSCLPKIAPCEWDALEMVASHRELAAETTNAEVPPLNRWFAAVGSYSPLREEET